MVAAFVLHLSTTTSTTIEVGMKDVWTGLVEVFGMIRTNLLDERFIFKRKSGGAIVTVEMGKLTHSPCFTVHSMKQTVTKKMK